VRIDAISDLSEENLVRTIARISKSLIIFAASVCSLFNVTCGFSFSLMTITTVLHTRLA
jgi:hypothetical protein